MPRWGQTLQSTPKFPMNIVLHRSTVRLPWQSRAAGATATAAKARGIGTISIIVPVLNEAGGIRDFLHQLRVRAPEAEIIVVDGGSFDGTREVAEPLCDRLVISVPGRGIQMNAGARAATGDVLWFLHADVEPPAGCLDSIGSALADENAVGGYFRIRLPRPELVYRLTDCFAHHAGKLLRVRCGDHGFFCRRAVYEEIGGFPEVPLMEDVEFYRALRCRGGVRAVGPRLIVSPRRYEAVGPVRLTFAFGLIAMLYACGAPRWLLGTLYQRMCVATTQRRRTTK